MYQKKMLLIVLAIRYCYSDIKRLPLLYSSCIQPGVL